MMDGDRGLHRQSAIGQHMPVKEGKNSLHCDQCFPKGMFCMRIARCVTIQDGLGWDWLECAAFRGVRLASEAVAVGWVAEERGEERAGYGPEATKSEFLLQRKQCRVEFCCC